MALYHALLGAALIVAATLAPDAARAAAAPEPPAGAAAKGAEAARDPAAPPPAARAKSKPRMSDRCNTPAINCILMDRQAAGSSCWCVTPFGPSYGRVR